MFPKLSFLERAFDFLCAGGGKSMIVSNRSGEEQDGIFFEQTNF